MGSSIPVYKTISNFSMNFNHLLVHFNATCARNVKELVKSHQVFSLFKNGQHGKYTIVVTHWNDCYYGCSVCCDLSEGLLVWPSTKLLSMQRKEGRNIDDGYFAKDKL